MTPSDEFYTLERTLDPALSSHSLCAALRSDKQVSFHLDSTGKFSEHWSQSGLVALSPEPMIVSRITRPEDAKHALADIDRVLVNRRAVGGTGNTGIALLLGYDFPLAGPDSRPAVESMPNLAALRVDRSVHFASSDDVVLSLRSPAEHLRADALDELRKVQEHLDGLVGPRKRIDLPPLQSCPRSSLPREAYLQAVKQVLAHIGIGDIYQANLCQQFRTECRADPYELYCRLAAVSPAPHSAFFQSGGLAVASVSPERFLRQYAGRTLETLPIKGTAPRVLDPGDDRIAADALLVSEKDRAELLMIVDLERNDLGRICKTGSVKVTELAALRSYETVHHLVARIEGQLEDDVGLPKLVEATFPGGSITGAPKVRAMEILAELEPVSRNFFSGCLFWFGDDGSFDSSILIRSLVLFDGQAMIGAGGGIVSDSDPEKEWLEANHKARPLTTLLGFDPEEAE